MTTWLRAFYLFARPRKEAEVFSEYLLVLIGSLGNQPDIIINYLQTEAGTESFADS